ncbi:MAG: hypothetical protein A3I66_10070 [Burkholderiales bacterium RIFCSPLOWO2_02_FULL_57_36]|nr:MAG: hypothetical protein A3I66_10070 [Burkholderiales bacterium RIFCSPLOWO2_02_FULL_57_36]
MIKLIVGFLCAVGAFYASAQDAPSGAPVPFQHVQGDGTNESVPAPRGTNVRGEKPPSPRHARSAENERTLPGIVFRDVDGRSSDADKLRLNGNWVLIVLDSSMPSAQKFLSALAAKKDVLDERTTILLVGSDAMIEKLSIEKASLPGVRWMHANDAGVIKGLDLTAVPSMLGMRGEQKIAWKFSGIPNPPEKAVSMIQGWLKLNPVANAPGQ